MMRNHFLSITLVFASLLISCSKESTIKPSGNDGFIATCEQQAPATKTQLYEGSAVLWDRDDAIRVYDSSRMGESGYTGSVFTLDPADAGKKEGRFIGLNEAITSVPCHAVYPSTAVKSTSSEAFSITLPGVQYYREGSFYSGDNISVAKGSGDGSLSFRNVCGLLGVNVSGIDDFYEASVTTLGNEALWGEGTIDMSSETPVLAMGGEITAERKTLTLHYAPDSPEADGQFVEQGAVSGQTGDDISGDDKTNRTFYFVVPVGTLSQGFIITVKTRNGEYMQRYTGAHIENTIERSMCTAMPSQQFFDESDVVISTDVQNKAFYKDGFSDAGPGNVIKMGGAPPAFKMLAADLDVNMTYEYLVVEHYGGNEGDFTAEEIKRLQDVFAGNDKDANGVMLYPDGEPRFKLLYLYGGYPRVHSTTLSAKGRENVRQYVYSGGSYSGSCGGAFIASAGVPPGVTLSLSVIDFASNLSLWPGFMREFVGSFENMCYTIPDGSPLLDHYDYGGDNKVANMHHGNGPYFVRPSEQVPGTEVLAYYDFPGYECDKQPSIIAYKPSIYSGIVLPMGSHPEYVTNCNDERCHLTAALYRYGLENVGIAKVKGVLHNGETRRMTKSTEDNDPAYTKVGDRQCHHFAFALPPAAKNIRVRLESLEGFNLSLRMAKSTFAFKEDAQYARENDAAVKELRFNTLPRGTYYVGVQCEDTVTTSTDKYGTIYTGGTEVLNGAPYTISVSWEIGEAEDDRTGGATENMNSSVINL